MSQGNTGRGGGDEHAKGALGQGEVWAFLPWSLGELQEGVRHQKLKTDRWYNI